LHRHLKAGAVHAHLLVPTFAHNRRRLSAATDRPETLHEPTRHRRLSRHVRPHHAGA
jgi:hypothetical protein